MADQYNKFYTEVFEDAPEAFKSPRANNHLTAHEYSHLVYQPDWKNKVGLSVYNPSYNKEYLKWLNKNSPIILAPTIGSKMINGNDKTY